MSSGSCSTRASHSSANSFQTLRRGASSRESLGRRPPRSGNWASNPASTNFKNQARSTCRARRRLSSCWRWSTSAGGRLLGNSREVGDLGNTNLPRLNHSQPRAVPTSAEITRAITTGHTPPSAASSRSSARVRKGGAETSAGAGSAGVGVSGGSWGSAAGGAGAGGSGAGVGAGGTRATVRSARGTGPVLSGIAKA